MVFSCSGCKLNEIFVNSKRFKAPEHDLESNTKANSYELNIRLVYALRAIGKGLGFAQTCCGLMHLPKPPAHAERYLSILCPVVKSIAEEIMQGSVVEAVQLNNDNTQHCGCFGRDMAASRPFISERRVVTLTCIDSGKVLDVSILSKHCLCKNKHHNQHEVNCKANYAGTSGGMELEGVKEIFRRSVARYGVQYETYLSDGDSKAYEAVLNDKPYGEDFKIKKIECVGHVQKRIIIYDYVTENTQQGHKVAVQHLWRQVPTTPNINKAM